MDPSQNDSFGSLTNGHGGANGYSSGGQIFSQAPVNGAMNGGPVILNNGGEKKSKKWVWAIIALSLCITAIVLVLFVFLGNHYEDAINNYKKSFNKLANYVIYGTDSDEKIEEKYNASKNYYFLTEQSTEESREALFERTSLLLDDLKSAHALIPKDNLNNDEDYRRIDDIINDEQEILGFMKVVYMKNKLKQVDIERKFSEIGYDSTKTRLLSYYDFSSLGENQYVSDYSELFNVWVEAQLDVLNALQDYGCVTSINVLVNCSKELDDEIRELINNKKDVLKEAEGALRRYYSLSSNFVANIFLMNDYIFNNKNGVIAGENYE